MSGVGVVGAVVGGSIFGTLGVARGGGVLDSLISAVIGAVVLLFPAGLIRRKRWIFGLGDGDPEARLGGRRVETFS